MVVIITRGLAEMTCIGTAYGASPLTFLGLAGVGDLFLTCSSPNSRNYTVGYRLGAGESLDEITKTLGSVAEGVSTAKGVKKYIDELDVRAPIASSVSVPLTWSADIQGCSTGVRSAVRRQRHTGCGSGADGASALPRA